jgi:HD-like signal output (HDOD) protein/CheY-like chemotaxis protein
MAAGQNGPTRRILLVDDEPQVLDVLRARLAVRRQDWTVQAVASGREAMGLLRSERFDAVVTDMQMPEMNGVELLKRVRRIQPDVMRIVLSFQTNHDQKIDALPVAHQLLDKPVAVDVLDRVIARALTLRDRLGGESAKGQVGQLDRMPSVPRLYFELSAALNDPEIALSSIGAIIEKDIAMTARVLQVVNSAYFALARPVSTINSAVSYLGTEALRTLVLSAALVGAFEDDIESEDFSIEDLHTHSIKTGLLAKRLVTDLAQASLAYAAGVLHDVGMLVLATRMPETYAQVRDHADAHDVTMTQAEVELVEITHADIGAFLLGMWGLPTPIVDAVARHHAVQSGNELDAIGAVHIANALISEQELVRGAPISSLLPAMQVETAAPIAAMPPDLDLDYVERLGKLDQVPRWRGWATEMYNAES